LNEQRNRILILDKYSTIAIENSEHLRRGGFLPEICRDMDHLCRETERGVGAIVLLQDSLSVEALKKLAITMNQQPVWSQIPFVAILERGQIEGHREWLEILEPLGNVTLIERPVTAKALLTVMRMAMALRHKQYEVKNLIAHLAVQVQMGGTDMERENCLAN
jgi:two-component system, sensor histidine kinase